MSDEEIEKVVYEEEIHPAVQLMLDRMETNPEEFLKRGYQGHQWQPYLDEIRQFANVFEKKLLKNRERNISLDATHKRIVQKLLEGTELVNDDHEYERDLVTKINNNRLLAQQMAQQQGLTAAQNPYANSVGIGTKSPMQPLVIGSANGTEAMRITANGKLNIGGETLDAGIIKKMKGALGL
jgi:hypothetical protein